MCEWAITYVLARWTSHKSNHFRIYSASGKHCLLNCSVVTVYSCYLNKTHWFITIWYLETFYLKLLKNIRDLFWILFAGQKTHIGFCIEYNWAQQLVFPLSHHNLQVTMCSPALKWLSLSQHSSPRPSSVASWTKSFPAVEMKSELTTLQQKHKISFFFCFFTCIRHTHPHWTASWSKGHRLL